MSRKSRFTAEQRKWWQNELTKYYQSLNGTAEAKQPVLWCMIDEWVTNYETNVVDLKAKIIEGFGPKS